MASLILALSQREWIGDAELIAELEDQRNGATSRLSALDVDLEEIGEALNQSPADVAYIDLATGVVWPSELFEGTGVALPLGRQLAMVVPPGAVGRLER